MCHQAEKCWIFDEDIKNFFQSFLYIFNHLYVVCYSEYNI